VGWLDELAADLEVQGLSEEESARLLSVARQIAHGVERRITPLAAFLIGTSVGAKETGGSTRAQALDNAIRTVESILPSTEPSADEDHPSDPS